jgi:hypothetical protein
VIILVVERVVLVVAFANTIMLLVEQRGREVLLALEENAEKARRGKRHHEARRKTPVMTVECPLEDFSV